MLGEVFARVGWAVKIRTGCWVEGGNKALEPGYPGWERKVAVLVCVGDFAVPKAPVDSVLFPFLYVLVS